MAFDRRKTNELVQALLRARNRKDGDDAFENVAQTSTASGDGSYGEPAFGGTRFFFASQPGVATRDKAASQSHKLIPAPRPHPFRGLARSSYTDGAADMAKARGVPADDQIAPSTLSWLANLQTSHDRRLGAYHTEHKPTVGYPVGKAFDLNMYPASDAAKARAVERPTQMGFGGARKYQSAEDTKKGFDDLGRRAWGHDGTAKTTTPGHRPPTLRLADSEPDMAKKAPHQEKKMPKIRYPTSGEIWSEFLGGIGKGIAQTFSDALINSAKARAGTFGGVYIDTPNPVLFGPPTSPWDDTGRKIAPGIMVVVRPVQRRPKTWNGKIIGKVEPPKHLKPGTVLFGDDMHEKVAKFLVASYPETIFDANVKRGQRGVDMKYQGGLDHPHIEIKPNKPHSQKQLNRQMENWEYEEQMVRVISYDEQGNIYDGFGY